MKIRSWFYSFLSIGILLLPVLHPVVVRADDWYEEQRRRRFLEEEERFWHNRLMRQLEQRRQQEHRISPEEKVKACFDAVAKLSYAQAYGLLGFISAYCTALEKGDYNTAWINMKRIAAIYLAKNHFSEAEVKEFLDIAGESMIKYYGWIPPEYR